MKRNLYIEKLYYLKLCRMKIPYIRIKGDVSKYTTANIAKGTLCFIFNNIRIRIEKWCTIFHSIQHFDSCTFYRAWRNSSFHYPPRSNVLETKFPAANLYNISGGRWIFNGCLKRILSDRSLLLFVGSFFTAR